MTTVSAWVATRKGLFEFRRSASGWVIAGTSFIGDPVNLALKDARDGTLYCALDLGHFGVKLHRRDAGSTIWNEIAAPAYPPQPPDQADAEATQDPHRIVRCAAAPNALWCQHHNGIWRSTNSGASWDECTNTAVANFGFAVAAHPQDADTAWFVPAVKDEKRYPVNGALCVTRTRDGGKSFEVLRKGLPQQHCYDLIYRHGLAVTDDGNTLMMGSTTGGLWVSDDGGDSWAALSNTLPPVYSVAFG